MKIAAVLPLCLVLAAALGSSPALALYKVVGPDGRVTYTDRPPTPADGRAVPLGQKATTAAETDLPIALREAVTKFPVILFTTKDCSACDQGRQMLQERGVPFRERIAAADEDRNQWMRVVGTPEAPVLKIGNQTLLPGQYARWPEYLDAAGYPRRSLLPATYQPAPPEPLAARSAPAPREPARVASPAADAAAPPAPSGTAFRF